MNNACPECSAVYAVAEKDIGRRIACKKCGAALIVAEDGLRRDDEKDAAPPPAPRRDDSRDDDRDRDRDRRRDRDDDDRDRDRSRDRRRGPGAGAAAGEFFNKLKGMADVSTWLFGIGLVFTIYSYFSPQIDKAKVHGRHGDYNSEKQDFEIYRRSIYERPDGKTPSGDETKAYDERKKEFDKKKVPELKDDIILAKASMQRGHWWTQMYRLIGFILLAFGSIGFLKPEQTTLKRILGGATILLILLQVIGGGVGLSANLGGQPGAGVPEIPPDPQ